MILLLYTQITYGAEAWILNKLNEDKLLVIKSQVLQKIFDPVSGVQDVLQEDEISHF